MQNNQTSLAELGYVAYKSEDGKDMIICPEDTPYKDRFSNIVVRLSSKELENNAPEETLQLVKNKLNAR